MNGICGWLGNTGTAEDAGAIFTRMLASRSSASPAEIGHATRTHAMSAFSACGSASVFNGGNLATVIEGRVRWSDAASERLANESSPAAALAALYQRHGKDCLVHLQGRFSLAILEPENGTALLAIDRMGINRLCFSMCGDTLVFGTNAGSVTAHPAIERKISPQGIFNYLFFHMVPSPGSIYSDVEKLQPAEYVLFKDGRLERGFYWEARWEDQEGADYEKLAREFRPLLRNAVKSSMDGSRTGAFLSGGTDSSTVAGMMAEAGSQPAETFSIGFQADGFDEMEYARIAANHFNTRPHEYYVTPDDVVRAIPLVAATYDEPFGNASAVPTYYCAKLAKSAGIDVMLAGDGGDELFGGNARYAKQKIFEAYWKIPASLRTHVVEPAILRFPGADRLPLVRKAHSYVRQARIPLPDRLESYNFLHADSLDRIFASDFLDLIDSGQPISLLREPYFRTRSTSSLNRMLHLDWKQTLADNDLRKVNRMCEIAGVEVRYPLLDDRIVTFSAMLPPSFKVRNAYLRWFYKEALKDFLPPSIITKSKHGFGLPFGLWMHTCQPLHDLALGSLESFRSRGYLSPAYIDTLLQQYRSNHSSYYGVMIWVIMMLEQWFQAKKQ